MLYEFKKYGKFHLGERTIKYTLKFVTVERFYTMSFLFKFNNLQVRRTFLQIENMLTSVKTFEFLKYFHIVHRQNLQHSNFFELKC